MASPEPRVVPWSLVPPGSLCETVERPGLARLFVRWPKVNAQYADAKWLPRAGGTSTTADWQYAAATVVSNNVLVLAEGLSEQMCDALAQMTTSRRANILLLAQLLGSPALQVGTCPWVDMPRNALAVVVTSEGGHPCCGEIVWRETRGKARFLGVTTNVESLRQTPWSMSTLDPRRGRVAVIHSDAASVPDLETMWRTCDVAGVLRACAARAPVSPPVPPPALQRVGDAIEWAHVRPGSLVRLPDGREMLRWNHPDADGNDTVFVVAGATHEPAWRFDFLGDPQRTCVVLGTDLPQHLCDAIAGTPEQPVRWTLASRSYYQPLSTVCPGSAWTWPSGWGVTYEDGHSMWRVARDLGGNGTPSRWMATPARAVEIELQLRAGVVEDGFWPTHGLAHVEMTGLSDRDLARLIDASDAQHELCALAVARWGTFDNDGRQWLGKQVAEYATFHLPPEARDVMIARTEMVIMGFVQATHDQEIIRSVTLRALGIYAARANDTYLGWWGQKSAPAQASSFAGLMIAYLSDPPDALETAHAVLGTDLPARVVMGSYSTDAHFDITRSGSDEWSLLEHAGRVSAHLFAGSTSSVKVSSRARTWSHGVISDHRGVACLATLSGGEHLHTIDVDLQPVNVRADHPEGNHVLVLWPFEPGLRGEAKLLAAALDVLRRERGATLPVIKHLRVKFSS